MPVIPIVVRLPSDSLVLLVGPAGSGKTTFAARHFPPTAVLSSDAYRAAVSGREADQAATELAFRHLHRAADARLGRGELVVVDATNVTRYAREPLLELAERHDRPAVAIALELTLDECLSWNALRPNRVVPRGVVRRQQRLFRRAVPHLGAEGFRLVHLRGQAQVDAAIVIVEESLVGR